MRRVAGVATSVVLLFATAPALAASATPATATQAGAKAPAAATIHVATARPVPHGGRSGNGATPATGASPVVLSPKPPPACAPPWPA